MNFKALAGPLAGLAFWLLCLVLMILEPVPILPGHNAELSPAQIPPPTNLQVLPDLSVQDKVLHNQLQQKGLTTWM